MYGTHTAVGGWCPDCYEWVVSILMWVGAAQTAVGAAQTTVGRGAQTTVVICLLSQSTNLSTKLVSRPVRSICLSLYEVSLLVSI